MKKLFLPVTIILIVVGLGAFVAFEAVGVKILNDPLANNFLCGFISRFALSLLFGWLLFFFGGKD